MMRRGFGMAVLAFGLVGCGVDSRESLITTTDNQINTAITRVGGVTDKLKEYVEKRKDPKVTADEAKELLKGAVAEAKDLAKTARELQGLYSKISAAAPATDAERAEVKKNSEARLRKLAESIGTAAEKHRELKTTLAAATKAHGEATFQDLVRELAEADVQFAALSRKR